MEWIIVFAAGAIFGWCFKIAFDRWNQKITYLEDEADIEIYDMIIEHLQEQREEIRKEERKKALREMGLDENVEDD